ncbi:response regulator transcription factor [Marinifilum fragile]|uniref:response regulator transcription factor n=1 Tax=Marinifilum fragile TaxID=570161 RepID=UPI0006D20A70|nr:response regulator transcription factor [Marinifilum fragile]
MNKKILLIEDDLILQQTIADFLNSSGFECICASTVKEGKQFFDKTFYPVILLDLSLPDGDGLDCISFIKSIWNDSGVIIISARDKLEDRVDGLNLGADDYLVKPFHLSELYARINALLRRNFHSQASIIHFENIEIETQDRSVKIAGEYVDFSKKEYDLLLYFIENKNRVLTKESLFEHVWGENSVFMDNSDFIYTHINRLRKKLKKHTGENYIKTVHGFGYKLEIH